MLSKEDMADVSWSDSEVAFVELEAKARSWLQKQWADNERANDDYRAAYINAVITFAHELGIPIFQDWKLISSSDPNVTEAYDRFISQVDSYTLSVTIRRARNDEHSVALESATKTKIHHLIKRIRDQIDAAELAPEKRDSLFRKLNAFAAEVDRQRTGMQVFGALFAGVSDALGDAVERSRMLEVMGAIGRMIGNDKSKEDANRPRVPAPKPSKRIEGPPQHGRGTGDRQTRGGWDKPRNADLDDDIPF